MRGRRRSWRPQGSAPAYPVKPAAGPRAGARCGGKRRRHRQPGGEQGHHEDGGRTPEGDHITAVTRWQDDQPRGHRLVLGDDNAVIRHKEAGRKARLHKKGSAFVMRVQVVPPAPKGRMSAEELTRPAAVMGELGFVGQED